MASPVLTQLADEVRTVSTAQAHELWIAALSRQGLAGGRKLRTVDEVAAASLGLHAARLPSPFATVLARLNDPDTADALFADAGTGSSTPVPLVTVRCMRKTLHALPPSLAGIAHTATRHFRVRDATRAAHNLGLSPGRLTQLVAEVVAHVAAAGQLGYRDLATRVAPTSREIPAVRAAIKMAWESGQLVYRNISPHWNREDRTFTLAARTAPDITTDGDRVAATTALITAYFTRYGPASLRDAAWWSGLSRSHIVAALQRCGQPVTAIQTPWSPHPLFLLDPAHHLDTADHLDTARGAAEAAHDAGGGEVDAVDFLAHEDVALKAYFETRNRYLGDRDPRVAFNQIGEVTPTLLHRGRVVGTWSWNVATRSVQWALFAPAPALRAACRARAEALTVVLRSRYDTTR